MSGCFNSEEDQRGLVIEFIDPDGVVVASVEDFDQNCAEGLSLEVSQRLRARASLRREVVIAYCEKIFADVLSPMHIEMAMDRLVSQGFRREERGVIKNLRKVD